MAAEPGSNVEAEATLPADSMTGRATLPPPRAGEADLGARYDLGPVLGRGGMGEVRLARDTRIDREVAIKLMHGSERDDASVARFFREARVQGALEHPAVVPVHDLGIDREGNPYFVMKKLAGASLFDVLARASLPVRVLLARLVDVCLAIELAHTRGVVHRDLKPANIMLGDFGEVYVLDWGLARLVGDTELRAVASLSGNERDANQTVAGALLGTPGYMSPEQARGDEVDWHTDVYALGCVLYEILVGAPALPRGMEAIEQTLAAACHRPSERAADVAPELDDLCARATAADPAARPTARAMANAIQAYLDGDRDLARRRDLADELATRANAACADANPSETARAAAMRDAGRAIAIDPDNAIASGVLARLLLSAPDAIPPAALAEADHERGVIRQRILRFAAGGFAVMLAMTPLLWLFHIRHYWPIVTLMIVLATIATTTWLASRTVLPMRTRWYPPVIFLMWATLTSFGLIFGPLFLLPTFMTGSLAAWLVIPLRTRAWAIVVIHLLVIAPLVALEFLGVLPRTVYLEGTHLVLQPWVVDLTPTMTIVVWTVAILSQAASTVNIMVSFKRNVEEAQDRRHAQAWHLAQLLPKSKDAPSAAIASEASSPSAARGK